MDSGRAGLAALMVAPVAGRSGWAGLSEWARYPVPQPAASGIDQTPQKPPRTSRVAWYSSLQESHAARLASDAGSSGRVGTSMGNRLAPAL